MRVYIYTGKWIAMGRYIYIYSGIRVMIQQGIYYIIYEVLQNYNYLC